jgi:hypothetical protein
MAISATSSGRTWTMCCSRWVSSESSFSVCQAQHLVGEAFEGLAEHDELAALRVARAQMEV